jgi:SNF2 family DNA or RNA helicase
MGMGKTIQTLACIVSNRPSPEDIKAGRTATLIVAPSGATRQWAAEIEKHTAHSYFYYVHIFKKSKDEKFMFLKRGT